MPEYYYWQVALYNRFMTDCDHAWVVLGIVDDEDRAHPERWVPSKDNVVLFQMPIDREEVEAKMSELREWYDKFIMNSVTPPYDSMNPGDVEMFGYLLSITEDELSKESLLDKLVELESHISSIEDGLKPMYKAREDIRKDLKEYMSVHDMESMTSSDGMWEAQLTSTERTSVDPVKMMEDGIDPTPYMISKITKVFRLKPFKYENQEE